MPPYLFLFGFINCVFWAIMAFMLIIMIFWVPILLMLHYFCNLFHVYFEQMTKSDAVGGQLSNMSGKVELLETWERTTTLLMWPWPVGMTIGWRLTGWSWMSRYSLIDYCTVGITSTSTTSTSLLNSRLKAAAGHWWSRQPDQIFFLSGCWAAGIELSSIFLFR